MPSDHVVKDARAFGASLKRAAAIAATGKLVLFGIVPTSPMRTISGTAGSLFCPRGRSSPKWSNWRRRCSAQREMRSMRPERIWAISASTAVPSHAHPTFPSTKRGWRRRSRRRWYPLMSVDAGTWDFRSCRRSTSYSMDGVAPSGDRPPPIVMLSSPRCF